MKGRGKNCSCNKCIEKLKKESQILQPIYYSNFYTNTEMQSVSSGESLKFKNNGPTNCFIFRLNDSQFNLTLIGTYEIFVSIYIKITSSCKKQYVLIVKCNDKELLETKMINNQNHINGYFLVSTEKINSVVSINNPINSNGDIEIMSHDDRIEPVFSHLIIKKIN